jgi:TonB family protein
VWSSRASIGWALLLSALLHLGGVVALRDLELPPARAAAARPPSDDYVAQFEPVEPGAVAAGELRRRSVLPEVIPGHAPSAGAIDRSDAEGRGGERASEEPAALLFPFVSPLTLQDTELNNLAASQAQRIRTAKERATLEERRATPNAQDEVLLASGVTGHRERRAPAKQDAAEGAPRAQDPSAPSEPRKGAQRETGIGPHARTAISAQEAASAREAAAYAPARGIQGGAGKREAVAARVTFARPNVDRGPAATTAERVDPTVRDDLDAELLAAKLQRSLVDTSVQRAEQRGLGAGGAPGEQAFGLQGSGSGAQARSYAPGEGNADALDTRDARYLRWFTQQRERVQKELVFPRARALAMDQGMSLYRVVLDRDGALTGKPRLVRSSGFSDFDAAAKIAIERALPFAPLPKELAPALHEIALLIPIHFANPMVR